MGALRKIAGRTIVPSVPGIPAVPESTQCTFRPDDPQYRPPNAGDGSAGSGCFTLPAGVYCEFRVVAGGRTERVCTPIGEIEVCT